MHRYSALALSALVALSATPALAHPHPQGQPCDPPAGTTSTQPGTADQAPAASGGTGDAGQLDKPGGGGGATGGNVTSDTGANAAGTGNGNGAFDDIDRDRPNQSGRQ